MIAMKLRDDNFHKTDIQQTFHKDVLFAYH